MSDVTGNRDGTSVNIELFAMTDVGIVRKRNEDTVIVGDLDTGRALDHGAAHSLAAAVRGPLFVVCDGMGGGSAGDVASRVAADTIWHEMSTARHSVEQAVFARLLRRSIRAANERVRIESDKLPKGQRMGTTAAAAGVVGDMLLVAHVGDCRAYVERDGHITAMTRDQSVVSALVRAGKMSEVDARYSSQRAMVLQALGVGPDVEVSISVARLRRGDRMVLCSDGLHGVVPERAMAAALARAETVEDAAVRLVNLARVAGAPDNITVVIASFAGDALEVADPSSSLRFREYDPSEEGDAAYADTSYVARRLANRVGLKSGDVPKPIPATGQHASITEAELSTELARRGPAEKALAAQRNFGVLFWLTVLAGVAGLALLAYLLYRF